MKWHVERQTKPDAIIKMAYDSESEARDVYAAFAKRIRQGEVRLIDPAGRCIVQKWAPNPVDYDKP